MPTKNPLSDYFSSYDQPLLGGDPYLKLDTDEAWDADLHPHEYGDQSGHVCKTSWDEHSFTDSECFSDEGDVTDSVDDENCDENDDGDWSIVYTTTSVSMTNTIVTPTNTSNSSRSSSSSCGDDTCTDSPEVRRQAQLGGNSDQTTIIPRRDSRVRFCQQLTQEHSYEHCSREEHAQLYYSCHELQKFIEEMRLDAAVNATASAAAGGSGSGSGGNNNIPCNSKNNEHKNDPVPVQSNKTNSCGIIIVARVI